MNNICIVIRLCLQNFKRWISNPRIYFIGILLTVYISSVVFPLVSFCYSVETSITPWLFPLLTSNQEGLIIFTACIILLFCDAPFLDSTQPFYIIRSGRQKWILAQILYHCHSGKALLFGNPCGKRYPRHYSVERFLHKKTGNTNDTYRSTCSSRLCHHTFYKRTARSFRQKIFPIDYIRNPVYQFKDIRFF